MAHQRKLIRAKVVEILTTNVPIVSGRVYKTRISNLWESAEVPSLAVYTRQEESLASSKRPLSLLRTMQLSIGLTVQAVDDVDDAIDDLAGEIEAAMAVDVTLGRTCEECSLVSTELAVNESGSKPMGGAVLTFEVVYLSDF